MGVKVVRQNLMPSQYTIPSIPPAQDIDSLRLSITNALSKLVGQLNAAPTTLDGQNARVQNVATPTGPNDAVNKRYLHNLVGSTTLVGNGRGGGTGKDAYTVVFSASSINANDAIPSFIVGLDRNGHAEEAWLYADDAPVGTGGFVANIQKNGTSILATNLVLASASTGPVFVTTFTGNTSFVHGDIISLVVTSSGGAAGVSIGLVVKRQ